MQRIYVNNWYLIFSEIRWTSKFPLHQLKYKKYISLPGTNMYLIKVMLDKALPITEPLSIVWINDNYNRYLHFMESIPHNCIKNRTMARQIGCKKILSSKEYADHREYYWMASRDFDHIYDYYWLDDIDDYGYGYYIEKEVTWEEASHLCGLLGGHLPWFESRDSLSEILALLKLSQFLPAVEAIYIGLRSHENEVSNGFFVSWPCLLPSIKHQEKFRNYSKNPGVNQ